MTTEFNSTAPVTTKQLQEAGEISVYDQSGKQIKLKELWKDQTTILIFIRHFVSFLNSLDLLQFIPTSTNESNTKELWSMQ